MSVVSIADRQQRSFWESFIPGENDPRCFSSIANRSLNPDFKHWDIKNAKGETAAFAFVKKNIETYAVFDTITDIEFWKCKCADTYGDWTVAQYLLQQGVRAPASFTDEVLRIEAHGVSVAHVCVIYQCLPVDDDDELWELENYVGVTVAETAGYVGNLPVTSKYWSHLSRLPGAPLGYSLAHIAASRGLLPKGFTGWNLQSSDGITVAHVYAANLSKTLSMVNSEKTRTEVYAFLNRMPVKDMTDNANNWRAGRENLTPLEVFYTGLTLPFVDLIHA